MLEFFGEKVNTFFLFKNQHHIKENFANAEKILEKDTKWQIISETWDFYVKIAISEIFYPELEFLRISGWQLQIAHRKL